MSRHRAIRNLNLDDELADDDYDDDQEINPYDDISEDDRAQLEEALSQLIEVLGQPGTQSGFTEREMKDTLWDAYFDVDQSVAILIEERSRREQKEKRKADPSSSELPLTALQRLTLERRSSNQRGRVGMRGRGRGRGGLSSHVESRGEKRSADLTISDAKEAGESTPRPSKLAALAAAKASSRQRQTTEKKIDQLETQSSGKPLTKLQQKMQANILAREQRRKGVPSKEEELRANAIADQAKIMNTLANGEPIDTLFPHANPLSFRTDKNSVLGRLIAMHPTRTPVVPGGSPFLAQDHLGAFSKPSPDDLVLKAREESAAKKQQARATSKPPSGASTPNRAGPSSKSQNQHNANIAPEDRVSQLRQDIEGLGLTKVRGSGSVIGSDGTSSVRGTSVPGTPRVAMTHERIIEEYRQAQENAGAKKRLNLVVVGHVDAGKSTLMGRLLHLLGSISDKEYTNNERASAKIGKGSFAYAWALDSSQEERERGVTIDIAQDHFATKDRMFTLLDAPGHRDFIPNMISGAAQADAALLVIDASLGAFEAGFGPNGQTREHAILVRSLGVQQLIVVVNKMDAVEYDQARYGEIESTIRPFLTTSGFDASKVQMVPCGAFVGENLEAREAGGKLSEWYNGPTLVEVLNQLEPPQRHLDSPLRIPITNVFRAGQTAISSGIGVSGRILTGVLSVGDRLSIVPGDESGIVKAIEYDGESVPWAVAGSSVTVFLTNIEMNFITIGAILCPPVAPVPVTNSFIAQLLIFEPSLPILAGTTLDLHHHSSNLSVTVSELIATLDMKTGSIIKAKPRVLSRGATAKVRITFNSPLAIDTFANNRDLGRILLRMHGETVAAGIVLELV